MVGEQRWLHILDAGNGSPQVPPIRRIQVLPACFFAGPPSNPSSTPSFPTRHSLASLNNQWFLLFKYALQVVRYPGCVVATLNADQPEVNISANHIVHSTMPVTRRESNGFEPSSLRKFPSMRSKSRFQRRRERYVGQRMATHPPLPRYLRKVRPKIHSFSAMSTFTNTPAFTTSNTYPVTGPTPNYYNCSHSQYPTSTPNNNISPFYNTLQQNQQNLSNHLSLPFPSTSINSLPASETNPQPYVNTSSSNERERREEIVRCIRQDFSLAIEALFTTQPDAGETFQSPSQASFPPTLSLPNPNPNSSPSLFDFTAYNPESLPESLPFGLFETAQPHENSGVDPNMSRSFQIPQSPSPPPAPPEPPQIPNNPAKNRQLLHLHPSTTDTVLSFPFRDQTKTFTFPKESYPQVYRGGAPISCIGGRGELNDWLKGILFHIGNCRGTFPGDDFTFYHSEFIIENKEDDRYSKNLKRAPFAKPCTMIRHIAHHCRRIRTEWPELYSFCIFWATNYEQEGPQTEAGNAPNRKRKRKDSESFKGRKKKKP